MRPAGAVTISFALIGAIAAGAPAAFAQSQAPEHSAQEEPSQPQQSDDSTRPGTERQSNESQEPDVIVDLNTWNYDALYKGFTAEQILDTDVYGRNGEEVGEVENIIVGPNNRIRLIIVESGGLADIGDTHLAIGWNQIRLDPGADRIDAPVSDDNISDFSLFADERIIETVGNRYWRVTELIDDYVRLSDDTNYGYVEDVIFTTGGQVQSIVVNPDLGYGVDGYFGYPFRGYDGGWSPGQSIYELPYNREQISKMEPLDYRSIIIRGTEAGEAPETAGANARAEPGTGEAEFQRNAREGQQEEGSKGQPPRN